MPAVVWVDVALVNARAHEYDVKVVGNQEGWAEGVAEGGAES